MHAVQHAVWCLGERTFGNVVHVGLESAVERVVLRAFGLHIFVCRCTLIRPDDVVGAYDGLGLLACASVVELVAGSVSRCGRDEILHEGDGI